jgi:hypothetical protein
MHSLHVVEEVVSARKTVAGYRSLTVPEVAKMGPGAVAVHAMRLAFVTEEARSRRELYTNAGLLIAAEWLQMRVHILATRKVRERS